MKRYAKAVKVDITLPVYNEEMELEKNITKLNDFLQKNFKYSYKIIIANNASTDNSLNIAKKLSKNFSNVSYVHLNKKGRGRAVKKTWMSSNAQIVSYMDVDLSTNLNHFIEIVEAIIHSNYDIAVGSRLIKGAIVKRGLKREILSLGYNTLLKIFFMPKFTDAQCGFKALKIEVAKKLIPMAKDQNWFFDTELLLLAERHGYKTFEFPVKWAERKKSKVKIFPTIFNYSMNILRMRFRFWIYGT